MEEYNRNPENRPLARKDRGQADNDLRKEEKNRNRDDNRAEMDGKKGDLKTERTHPLGNTSALPGAEKEGDVGDAASGAGLGGNKGTGTRNKKDFT